MKLKTTERNLDNTEKLNKIKYSGQKLTTILFYDNLSNHAQNAEDLV